MVKYAYYFIKEYYPPGLLYFWKSKAASNSKSSALFDATRSAYFFTYAG